MEALIVRPRDERQLARLKRLFEQEGAEYSPKRPETLEEKIFRLYGEGHYTDDDLREFLSIPKAHRTDPFEVIEDGNIYWADRRNVEQTIADVKQAKKDIAEGRSISFDSEGELDAYFDSL